jgi:hypothetical protein
MQMDSDNDEGYTLTWNRGKTIVSVPIDTEINLPVIQGLATYTVFNAFAAVFSTITHADFNMETRTRNTDKNATQDEATFLQWHIKLGHAPFRNIRWAAQLGILPSKLKSCRNVFCPACLYGKQKHRP